MRDDVLEPLQSKPRSWFMVTVWHEGAWGYAATHDLSEAGLIWAFERAQNCAQQTKKHQLSWPAGFNWPHPQGRYASEVKTNWNQVSLRDKVDLLKQLNETLKCDDKIVYRESSLWWGRKHKGYLTNQGGDVIQNITYVAPDVSVTAADKTDAQTQRNEPSFSAPGRHGEITNN